MNSEKISSIVLAVLVAIAAIVCVLFCVGGSEEEIYSGEAFDAPNYTGAVLNVVYVFLCLAIVATIVSAVPCIKMNFEHLSPITFIGTRLSMSLQLLTAYAHLSHSTSRAGFKDITVCGLISSS